MRKARVIALAFALAAGCGSVTSVDDAAPQDEDAAPVRGGSTPGIKPASGRVQGETYTLDVELGGAVSPKKTTGGDNPLAGASPATR